MIHDARDCLNYDVVRPHSRQQPGVNENNIFLDLTYFSHKLYNMWIYGSTRVTNVRLEYPWLKPKPPLWQSLFFCYQSHVISKITFRDFFLTNRQFVLKFFFFKKNKKQTQRRVLLWFSKPWTHINISHHWRLLRRRYTVHIMLQDIWRQFIQSNIWTVEVVFHRVSAEAITETKADNGAWETGWIKKNSTMCSELWLSGMNCLKGESIDP